MERIRKYSFQNISSGRAENIPDFFHQVIEPQFQHTDWIKSMHKALLSYVHMDEPTFCVRLYGSYSKDKYHLLRRGFLTEYRDGTRLFFCDNTFTLLFAGLKIAGISFNSRDLQELLYQQKVKVGFGQTSQEKELSYFDPTGALKTNLNSKGWYQAHIKPAGYGYGSYDLKREFPNPPRDEWCREQKIRYVQENLANYQTKLLQAHLLRLIHPFNSFLVPKRNHLKYRGSNIGEEIELITHVQKYFKHHFPEEFEEFDKLSIKYTFPECRDEIKDIQWFESTRKPEEKFPDNMRDNRPKAKKMVTNSKLKREKSDLTGNLDKWIKSIGKEVFVLILYPEIDKNFNITYFELAQKYNRYSQYSVNSQKSRLASAKSIFRSGREKEALQIILDSDRLENNIREQAVKILNKKNS